MDTNQQFEQIIAICRDLFAKKLKDYGDASHIGDRPNIHQSQPYT